MLGAIMSTHSDIVDELTQRWPEQRVAPSLARIQALVDLLGDPSAVPGRADHRDHRQGSTAIIVDALLRAQGLRTGRYASRTSPI
jgi:dihydrofolate synthase/folylpolyglutamate synthase